MMIQKSRGSMIALPKLTKITRMGLSFNFILISAVWQHILLSDRARSFRKLISLLKPGGVLALTFPLVNNDGRDGVYPVSIPEIKLLSNEHGLVIVYEKKSADLLGRADRKWVQFALRVPDDGTGALPILRRIILNDDKSSSYKLALLRVFCRIADTWPGFVRHLDDNYVSVPLGLVGLTWIRLFVPLLTNYLPQSPSQCRF